MSEISTNLTPAPNVGSVKAAVIDSLGIDRSDVIEATTPLASMPEFDSLAVLELIVELEQRFGITIEDEDVSAEIFESVTTLAAFVAAKSS